MTIGINYPLDFERLETTRLFVLKLQSRTSLTKEAALLAAYRIWGDWFLSGVEHRPLKVTCRDVQEHHWGKEDVCYVLTESAGVLDAQILMQAALESGFCLVTGEGAAIGLANFWRHNPHCSPYFKNIQSRGGHAAAAARRVKEMGLSAEQRRIVLESQSTLPFGTETPTETEKNKSILLIDRLDRACGRPLRSNADYLLGSILADALRVIRQCDDEQIALVESYVLRERRNPSVPNTADRALIRFTELLHQAS